MREWQKVKLSTIITQCQNTEKIFDMENEHYITLSSYGKGAHERIIKDGKYPVPFLGYRVRNGQFIYSRIDARNGAYDIISPELDGYVVSKDFPVYDIDTEKVLPRFLLRSVLSSEFINQVKHSSFGATNRMRIKEDVFGNYTIALPPMEQQQEIVDILDAVLSIIKSRQSELSVLDDLVKARFVELMEKSDLGGETTIESITKRVKVGFVGTCEKYYTDESGIPMLRTGNITEKGIDLSDLKYVTAEFHNKNQKSQIHAGDLLIARHGSNGQANVYFGPDAQCLNAVVIVPNQKIASSLFLAGLINSPAVKRQIERTLVGSTQHVVNTKSIAGLSVRIPDMDVQKEYESFVMQVDKSKVAVQAALDKAQLLFDSLMQEYFG